MKGENMEQQTRIKKQPIVRNTVKVKALLFLRMRKEAGNETTEAWQIARAINGNCKSLYILLERWTRWELVTRFDGSPYSYAIADEGERYLSKINAWFFSGYYSKKRKHHMRGYRGTEVALMLEILVAAQAIYYVQYEPPKKAFTHATLNRQEPAGPKELLLITPPFNKAENFIREPMPDGFYKRWGKEHLLRYKFDQLQPALQAVGNLITIDRKNKMACAVVNANVGIVWTNKG